MHCRVVAIDNSVGFSRAQDAVVALACVDHSALLIQAYAASHAQDQIISGLDVNQLIAINPTPLKERAKSERLVNLKLRRFAMGAPV